VAPLSALHELPIFAEIPAAEIRRIVDKARPRSFPTGRILMEQGESSDCVYIILSGSVRVENSHPDLKSPLELATLGPGELVGEIGVLDGGTRSATVKAVADTETLQIPAHVIADLLVRFPEASKSLLATTIRRLRDTDNLAVEMRREQAGPSSS